MVNCPDSAPACPPDRGASIKEPPASDIWLSSSSARTDDAVV